VSSPLTRSGATPTPTPSQAATSPLPTPAEDTLDTHRGAASAEVAELVARAQNGDAEAFGALYDRYVDLVYRYVFYRVASRQLTEDLVSETFLRALRRIGSFTWQGRDFAAWLVTIARNLIADHYKSGRFRLEVTTDDIVGAASGRPTHAAGPESQVLESMTNETLLRAVKQLNPEQQECIVLRFLQGFSVSETAQAMGKNEGAIKALQYRAVRALARMLPADEIR
jgi:RNA polymerase sigma-70 factor (ECF subfamily)